MNASACIKVDYEDFRIFGQRENKPKQSQFHAPTHPAMEREVKNCSLRLLINQIMSIYKPDNDRYYIRHISRCSSMAEHSFRKAEVVGSTPTIGCIEAVLIFFLSFRMSLDDTSAEAEAMLCRLYWNMTTAQKAQRVFSAYRMGKMLSMGGIRMNYPDATEEQIWNL